MQKKVSIFEKIFARLFNIVAGKDYLVSIQWTARSPSQFIPLNPFHRNLILTATSILGLGLLALVGELGLWIHREASLQFSHTRNASLKRDLASIQKEQRSLETTLEGITGVEDKVRALYGMNSQGKAVRAFGVGGRRADSTGSESQGKVVDQIHSSSMKSRQLRHKIDYTLSSFKQIQEFVRYRHNLWEHTPFVLPAKGQLTSGFGERLHPVTGGYAMHNGLDIANSKWTPIFASADGIVTTSQQEGNFGNMVVVDHGNGYVTKYAHLTKSMVEKGQIVKRFGLIGYMGDSGRVTGIHLHYEVHRDGIPQNPAKYILPSGILVD